MPTMSEGAAVIRRLHEHRAWVNARLLDAAATLNPTQIRQPFEIGRGSVWATLVHLHGAESVWLAALEGEESAPFPSAEAFSDVAQLGEAWGALEQRWKAYLASLDDSRLSATVRRRPAAAPGVVIAVPARDVLLHVCTHAQYTTAQCANMLRHLGVTPPDTMLITLSRNQYEKV